jgi:acyl transferase domain-containing protein/NAD(P)-dependent dehydrogenase (short-subunit alcohol dehydrogenase family)/acyl carrier protein
VIGLGCLFPKAADVRRYWANIVDRVDAITPVPPTHWRPEDYFDADPKKPDHTYARRGGFLAPVDFPALDFGIAPNALEAIDTTQLLGLVVARQALEDAGYGNEGKSFDRGRVGVILGVTGTLELVIPLGARLGHPLWRRALKDAGVSDAVADDVIARISEGHVAWQEDSFPGLLGNVVAGRIANRLDLGGTNCVVDAACASSLSAVHLAILELTTGRADMVLTGGMDTFNDIFMYMCFSKTPALSPTGDARPFDAGGDGTILGEGLGCLLLKRLSDAERDGDRIYAVIKSIGTSSDGKGQAIYAPSPAGQMRALRQAYNQANVTPDTIELVEAHGTGTRAGDAAEVQALTEVYRGADPTGRWCALGSVKSQIGHTKAAAGAAGLIKAVLALHHKVLPPTIKVQQPIEPLANGQSPFYVNTEARPWLPAVHHPRRAAVSAFGFGGSNFHCVLEEHAHHGPAIDWDGDVQILAFSAETEDGLHGAIDAFPASAAWEQLRGEAARLRSAFQGSAAYRLLIVLENGKSDPAKLLGSVRGLMHTFAGRSSWSTPEGIFFGKGELSGKLALLFCGQGSQYVGMFRELACRFPAMQEALAAADGVFAAEAGSVGGRLSERIYPPPAFCNEERERHDEALRQTDVAQPALGAVAVGALGVLRHFAVRAEVVAGHSYGELAALWAAGRFDAAALHRLSRLRGRLMASGTGDRGSMLAVMAPLDAVEKLLAEECLPLIIANKNTPRQAVLSGSSDEVRRAVEACAKRGWTAKRLPVSAAFHSRFVADSSEPLARALADVAFVPGTVPVFSNTTAQHYPTEPGKARALLAGQLAAPVEFVEEVRNLYRHGARTFLEIGPGARLTGLVSAILEGKPHVAVALDASSGQRDGVADLARALAQLAVLSHPVDLKRWDEGARPLLAAPKKLTVPISGANYVKPRPPRPPVPELTTNGEHEPAVPPLTVARSTASAPRPTVASAAEVPKLETRTAAMSTPSSSDPSVLGQALRITQENLAALQKLGEQTARLHGQFLENQNRTLAAFQAMLGEQQKLIQGNLSGTTVPPVSRPLPVPTTAAVVMPEVIAPAPAPPRPEPIAPVPLRIERPSPTPIAVAPTAAAPTDQTAALLLAIVAEKTGYPAEMLALDMELDTDLGIDSIKRVEIFSTVQERMPGTPVIKPEHLGSLRTLRDVVAFLAGGASITGKAQAIAPPAAAAPATERDDTAALLLSVISEKTGYPAEMLALDMDLDTDLGIDSIKRIEIFSMVQEKLPSAPVIKPEHLGGLRTVRDVAAFLGPGPSVAAPVVSVPEAASRVVVEIAEPEATASAAQPLQRYVVETVALDAPRESLSLFLGAEVWVTDDNSGLSSLVTARLGLLGHRTRLIAWKDLGSLPRPTSLSGLIVVAPSAASDAFLRDAFRLLQIAGPGLRQGGKSGGSICVTVARLDGAFGLDDLTPTANVVSGGLAGLAKTAAHEWPEVQCKALDLDAAFADPDEAALAVVEEALLVGPREVGIRTDGRTTLRLTEHPLTTVGSLSLGERDVVVISGGARGVTAEAAVALAQQYRCSLVLLGRSPEPGPEAEWLKALTTEADIKKALLSHSGNELSPRHLGEQYQRVLSEREIRQTLQRIRAAGANVLYRPVDVRSEPEVSKVLADVRARVGPIRGLVHGAGVLADRRIEDKTLDQFDAVYATKVQGLRTLLAATEADDLQVIGLFSSSTGRFGRTGQVDYAAANEVLNKLAQQQARRRPGCRVVAINWGPWDGGMVSPGLKQIFEREGVSVIPLRAGGEHFVRELSTAGPVEVVVLGAGSVPDGTGTAVTPVSSDLPVAFERILSVEELPVLRSHVIAGRAVLPAALMVEWLAHGALHGNPGLAFHGFDDLRVCKGVRLTEGQNWSIKVRAGKALKRQGLYDVPTQLHGAGTDGRDVLHARATIVLAPRLPAASQAAPELAMPAYPRTRADIYRDVLFQGGDLQGLQSVDGCSDRAILATAAAAPAPSEWLRQPLRGTWLADPLVLDCAFQAMIVWSFENHGCGSLPAHVGHYRQFVRSFPRDGVRICAEVTQSNAQRAVADVSFLDRSGSVVAHIKDYECVIDASLNQAFQRNQLTADTHP